VRGEGEKEKEVGSDVSSQALDEGSPEASSPPMSNEEDAAWSHTARQLQHRPGGGRPVKVMGTRKVHWWLTRLQKCIKKETVVECSYKSMPSRRENLYVQRSERNPWSFLSSQRLTRVTITT
jgi:hypothetical protein